jgi:hypothetical protein
MIALCAAKAAAGATTSIHVLYHRYKGNLDDERLMKAFCRELGFDFIPVWAYMTPLEKVLAYADDDAALADVTAADLEIIERLVPPPREALAVAAKYKDQPCILLDEQITMDFRGDVTLCCAVYDARKYGIANFLDTPMRTLQAMKSSAALCTRCTARGAHVYVTYKAGREMDELAERHLVEYYAGALKEHPPLTAGTISI